MNTQEEWDNDIFPLIWKLKRKRTSFSEYKVILSIMSIWIVLPLFFSSWTILLPEALTRIYMDRNLGRRERKREHPWNYEMNWTINLIELKRMFKKDGFSVYQRRNDKYFCKTNLGTDSWLLCIYVYILKIIQKIKSERRFEKISR